MVEVYQFRIFLREISPVIWRRILLRSDQTLADLHYTLQIIMNWSDFHLHRFTIRGRYYEASSSAPVALSSLNFCHRERFLYEYDFGDLWQHEIRLEKRLPLEPTKNYPICIGGSRSSPEEDCVGKLRLESPRFYHCQCESQKRRSFSPLAKLLPERSALELLYVESKWASLVSYGLTTDLLKDVLPMKTSSQSVINNAARTAQHMEDELGAEQVMFAHGCLAEWACLPPPAGHLTVGLDGEFIHARDGENRKAGLFEVIAGKSVTWEGEAKTFGLVNKFDEKPKPRLFELLQSQGLQMNQDITFVSDGGDAVRDLQLYLSPWSEHILDWFHVTMRLTVMTNTAKGLPRDESLDEISTLLEGLNGIYGMVMSTKHSFGLSISRNIWRLPTLNSCYCHEIALENDTGIWHTHRQQPRIHPKLW